MTPRDAQRARDAEVKANLDAIKRLAVRHSLFTVPPAYTGTGGSYTSSAGYVVPLDMELRSMLLHSYRADIWAPADAGLVTGYYGIAVYEMEALHLNPDINKNTVRLKYLEGSYAQGSVVSAVGDVLWRQVHILPNNVPMFYNRQYFLWTDVQVGRARFMAPSRGRSALATTQGGLSGTSKPAAKLTVDMIASTSALAPCVELRSLYGTVINGDPSEVY